MKFKICLLFYLTFSQIGIAQWINLGTQGGFVFMTSDGAGYKARSKYISPSSGTSWFFSRSENDWRTSKGAGYFGGGSGCCSFRSFAFLNDSTGIAEGANFRQFIKTSDFGKTWATFGDNSSLDEAQITMVNDSVAYTVGSISSYGVWGGARFFKMTNSSSISRFEFDSLHFEGCNIEFVDQNMGFIALNDTIGHSFLFKTDDEGISWNSVFVDSISTIIAISFLDSLTGYISTTDGKVYKTQNGGISWSSCTQPTSTRINAMEFLNDTIGYVVGDFGEIFKTLDGGQVWIKEYSQVTSHIVKIQITSPTTAYCYTSDNKLLKNDILLSDNSSASQNQLLNVYPNPAHESIKVFVPSESVIKSIRIYSVNGKLQLSSSKALIDISSLVPGIYFVSVLLDDQLMNTKIMKM